jgi:hypothetical protein
LVINAKTIAITGGRIAQNVPVMYIYSLIFNLCNN